MARYDPRRGLTEDELMHGYRGLRRRGIPDGIPLEPPSSGLALEQTPAGGRALGLGSVLVVPLRVGVYVPHRAAIRPWLTWLAGRGWHVHRVGMAAYAHPKHERPGWLIGFAVTGEPLPSWWNLLRPHPAGGGRYRRPMAPARLVVSGARRDDR